MPCGLMTSSSNLTNTAVCFSSVSKRLILAYKKRCMHILEQKHTLNNTCSYNIAFTDQICGLFSQKKNCYCKSCHLRSKIFAILVVICVLEIFNIKKIHA